MKITTVPTLVSSFRRLLAISKVKSDAVESIEFNTGKPMLPTLAEGDG